MKEKLSKSFHEISWQLRQFNYKIQFFISKNNNELKFCQPNAIAIVVDFKTYSNFIRQWFDLFSLKAPNKHLYQAAILFGSSQHNQTSQKFKHCDGISHFRPRSKLHNSKSINKGQKMVHPTHFSPPLASTSVKTFSRFSNKPWTSFRNLSIYALITKQLETAHHSSYNFAIDIKINLLYKLCPFPSQHFNESKSFIWILKFKNFSFATWKLSSRATKIIFSSSRFFFLEKKKESILIAAWSLYFSLANHKLF